MKATRRSLGMRAAGLVVVVVAAAACGPRVPGATKPSATIPGATSTPISDVSTCPQAVVGKSCSTPGATPTPSSLPVVGVSEVAFSDAVHGWAVGESCVDSTETCTVLVDETSNAGASWSRPVALGNFPEEGSPGGAPATALTIRFLGTNIWVSGPGIYESHDGGVHWKRVFTSAVEALEPADGTAWAIAGCSIPDPSASCALFTSPIGSDVWTRAAVQPPMGIAAYSAQYWVSVLLERAPNGVAFVAGGSAQPGGQPWVAITRNDGATWRKSLLPCTFGIAGLRSPDGTTVWLLCGGGGGAGSGPKAVYVSVNGGTTWEERANDVSDPPVGIISGAGYANGLAVTDGGIALISSSRAGIIRSVDGGRIWSDSGSNATCLLEGNGVTELWLLANGLGWALEENDDGGPDCPLLIRTTDAGLAWTAESAPLGWTALQGQ